MSFIYTPPAAPTTPQSVNSLNFATNNVHPATAAAQFGSHTGSTLAELAIAAGAAFASVPSASFLGSMTRLEVTSNAAGATFGFGGATISATPATALAQTPFVVGDASIGPNNGGFYLEMYGGIGENYAAGFNPLFFFGLSSGVNGVPNVGGNTIYSAGAANTVGLLCNTTIGGSVANWSWVAQRGAGAPSITALAPTLAPAAQQVFAIRISAPPSSDAILLSISRLSALGVWSPLVTNVNLTGIGPAQGQRLCPTLFGQNNYTGAGTNGLMVHRMYAVADQYSVGRAFS